MQGHAGGKTKMSLQRRRYLRAMTTETPEPCYERFCLAYPSGTVVMAFYADGATLCEVRVTHPWR